MFDYERLHLLLDQQIVATCDEVAEIITNSDGGMDTAHYQQQYHALLRKATRYNFTTHRLTLRQQRENERLQARV